MTSKATSLNVRRALRAGFRELAPLRPITKPVRTILVRPDIEETLNGRGPAIGFPHLMADRVVSVFIAGYLITVSRKSAKNVDLEKLENLDEVWALCFRQPRPGWRLLGRLLEQDVFVGLQLYERHYLRDRQNYSRLAAQIPQIWSVEFGTIGPLRATDLSAYLTGVYRDVDQAP